MIAYLCGKWYAKIRPTICLWVANLLGVQLIKKYSPSRPPIIIPSVYKPSRTPPQHLYNTYHHTLVVL